MPCCAAGIHFGVSRIQFSVAMGWTTRYCSICEGGFAVERNQSTRLIIRAASPNFWKRKQIREVNRVHQV